MNLRAVCKGKMRGAFLAAVCLALPGCSGGGGGSGDSAAAVVETFSDLLGTVRGNTGSQSELNQWVVVSVDRDSTIARAVDVNAVGFFKFERLDISQPETLLMLDPQWRFASILSMPGPDSKSIVQYFKPSTTQLPTLVLNGPVMSFTDSTGLSWESDKAVDTDSDSIPDGKDKTSLLGASNIDTDKDGIINTKDGDIDGDGVPNPFDHDDDGDGIIDVLDADANGDGVIDATQALGDHYFPRGLQYLSVQIIQDFESSGAIKNSIKFSAKVYSGVSVEGLAVRTASATFTGSEVSRSKDESTGAIEKSTWDSTLADDGKNEDGMASDLTYGASVVLATGVTLKTDQVIFVSLNEKVGETTNVSEFPFVVPPVTSGAITGTYTAGTRTVAINGAPFAGTTDFRWSVHIYDANSVKVFASEALAGSVTSYVIPDGLLETGKTYTAKISAVTYDGVASYPTWIVRSPSFNLQ